VSDGVAWDDDPELVNDCRIGKRVEYSGPTDG
jgi:hypothetical protein